jgi:hypothetical protein
MSFYLRILNGRGDTIREVCGRHGIDGYFSHIKVPRWVILGLYRLRDDDGRQ